MKIEYRICTEENIDFLATLCNKLMKFQGDHAHIKPEIMSSMNYENRLKPEYANTPEKFMVVAYADNQPVGFAFGTIGMVTAESLTMKPAWAEDLGGIGFYPVDYDAPKKIGTFKLLYLDESYRNLGIGKELTDRTMTWLRGHEDVADLWVYVANGNEVVGKLYEKVGFHYSHPVWNGFIQAYRLNLV